MQYTVSFDRIAEVALHVSTIAGTEEKTIRILVNAGENIIDSIHNAVCRQFPFYKTMQKGMSYQHFDGNSVFVSGFCAWTMQAGRQNAEIHDNGYIEHIVNGEMAIA